MTPALRVQQAGFLTTVQDLGRAHAQRYGVPPGGAMDHFALVAANRLLGNPPGVAAIELTAGGVAFELLTPLMLAVTGADFGTMLDDEPLRTWTAVYARAGQVVHFGHHRQGWGARAYLAIGGGVDVPEILSSRSTCLSGGFGGVEGRPLRPGDTLAAGLSQLDVLRRAGRTWPERQRPQYSAQPTLRILPGPHLGLFPDGALAALLANPWRLGQQSNRIGYRLEGNGLPPVTTTINSHGVVPGAIQAPPDGVPILLMADAQTTGGYPIIAVVIAADLPLAAQLLPGDRLHFRHFSIDEAVDAWRTLHRRLESRLPQDDIVTQLDWAGA